MKNLFEILSNDERVIVLSSQEDKYIYTWNRSFILQCWEQVVPGLFNEIDARTLEKKPSSWKTARGEAMKWHLVNA